MGKRPCLPMQLGAEPREDPGLLVARLSSKHTLLLL